MSNGDEDAEEPEEAPATPATDHDLDEGTFDERLDEVAGSVEDAETEADLDDAEAVLDDIEADLEAADLPEPDDEDEEAPADRLAERVSTVREDIEAKRGPYAEDVAADVEEVAGTVRDAEWTEDGEREVHDAVDDFLDDIEGTLSASAGAVVAEDDAPAELADALETAAETVRGAGLDADEDADTIAALVEAADTLAGAVEDAEEWDDLSVREQLTAQGFYDSLNEKHKDYPPEWTALKNWENEGEVEKVLLSLNTFDSEFMERHALESLERMAHPDSVEPMLERAQKRDKPAIRILGRIGAEEAAEDLHEFLDGDPGLQRVTLQALGRIGSTESTQPVANCLDAEEVESVRSHAARALGLIGDTRAVKPLTEALAEDPSDSVRASAAWALVQVGTADALEAAAEYTDDRAYIVQAEAEVAADALEADDAEAPTA